jgi:DNA modification methylase
MKPLRKLESFDMEATINTILCGDCISGMNGLHQGCIDLAFADPPFNIGYDYDVYHDSRAHEEYVGWSRRWISAVFRVLKDDGTFWLAIGDEYAAELKIESQKIGFHCRSWVIWYYTFGVNCANKFSRSHAHLFHFVKDPRKFTFRGDEPENRIPSARQLVYNDKRANPKGRLPDDTWIIRPADASGELVADDATWSPSELTAPQDDDQTWTLRPQDLAERFKSTEDTWYYPRVAGTFKERAGFHGCQMPEQLLGRIIRTCSSLDETVLDPFAGSATTVAVAKKLGRRYLAFDISTEYVKHGLTRLESIRVGDPLDGSAEPLLTAPNTAESARKSRRGTQLISKSKQPLPTSLKSNARGRENGQRYDAAQLKLTLCGVIAAFEQTYNGFSADRVVADPDLDNEFVGSCKQLGLFGDARTWNTLLFRLRKEGRLAHLTTKARTAISWQDCDCYIFASEIALQEMLNSKSADSLDEILCDPSSATEFDRIARRFAPGFTSLEYRWAALKLRKQAKLARSRGSVLVPPSRLGKTTPVKELDFMRIAEKPGVYVLSGAEPPKLYVGEALNLRERLSAQFKHKPQRIAWDKYTDTLGIQTLATDFEPAEMLAWQSCLVKKYRPRLNLQELGAAR